MAKESFLDAQIKTYVSQRGGYVQKNHGSEVQSGVPDLIICYKGVFIALEDKAPNGKVSDKQLGRIKKIRAAKGIAEVAFSLDFVKSIFHCIDEGKEWTPTPLVKLNDN